MVEDQPNRLTEEKAPPVERVLFHLGLPIQNVMERQGEFVEGLAAALNADVDAIRIAGIAAAEERGLESITPIVVPPSKSE